MVIPFKFKIKFWFTNTIMATATGFVVGIIVPIVPFRFIGGSLLGFFIYQIAVYRYFWGNQRGNFEYQYKGEILEKFLKRLVRKHLGLLSFIRYFMDQFNNIGSFQTEVCKKLINTDSIQNSDDDRFVLYIKIASLALKDDNFSKEIDSLKNAIAIKPNDLIANYRLAVSLEKDGSAEDAIRHYEAAITDQDLNSEPLRDFILRQIDRIKTKGPFKKPPALGLRFMSW